MNETRVHPSLEARFAPVSAETIVLRRTKKLDIRLQQIMDSNSKDCDRAYW
jgi:hypothetical protein